MTVILVICTFAIFFALEYFLHRHKVSVAKKPALQAVPAAVAAPEPVWVAGYQLPDGLHYHKGHTWARVIEPDTVLIGMDDFASKLIGPARKVKTPAQGTWLKQGQNGFQVQVDGRTAAFVSPVEGEVLEVNPQLKEHPENSTTDPYGRGWILKMRVGELGVNLRNLFTGKLARRWVQEARQGLELQLMALSGSVLQDGGEPVADFAMHLPEEDWRRLVEEFLLT
jgi:glycine cleavage system H lipoate-binding protein